MPLVGQVMVILLLLFDELFAKILLLLFIERFDNTLLLLFDRFPIRSLVDDLPPRIVVILILAWITRSILVLYIIHTHPFALRYLLLLLVQSILMSLLTERFYNALLLLLHGWLSVAYLLMFDDHTDRIIRITDWIVLDNLLRVVVMSAVVKSGNGNRMIGGYGFDHFRSSSNRLGRVRLAMRLVVIVHLELGRLLLM